MGTLARPSVVAGILAKHGIRLTRALGQHFLVDGNVLRRLVEGAGLRPGDTVLEIGPGIGTLTEELCGRAGRVVAVETDRRLIAALQDTLGGRKNLEIFKGDAMQVDLPSLFAPREPLKLVSNLPYSIATPLILRVLRVLPQLESMTVTVQRELADRYLALPRTHAYNAVSVKLQFLCDIRRLAQVPPTVFFPPPRVESSILYFERKKVDLSSVQVDAFFAFLNGAFSSRRKKMVNALSGARDACIERSAAEEAMDKVGVATSCRAEELPPEKLLEIFFALQRLCGTT